jgi:uncharacterized membrane protein YfcA
MAPFYRASSIDINRTRRFNGAMHYLWPCVTAFLAGIVNALAGGGTLLTFPALMSALDEYGTAAAVMANATSTIALVPASVSSAWAYRRELEAVKRWLRLLIVPSLIGGALGSLLVVWFPDSFKQAVPWLILTASLLFTVQPLISKYLGHTATSQPSQQRVLVVMVAQLVVAVYGGYFGAGIGILMLSALSLMGMSNLHEMNALKTVLGTCINGIAVVIFVVQDLVADGSPKHPHIVHWPLALGMMFLAMLGGYVGAKYGRLLPSKYVRYLVIAIGFGLTGYYFVKAYYPEIMRAIHFVYASIDAGQ